MSEEAPRKPKTIPGNLRGTNVANRKGRAVAVTVDPHGKVHYGADNIEGDHVIAILGERVTDEYLAELREDGVSYLFAGKDGHDMPAALEILTKTFGIKTLLLEGGGKEIACGWLKDRFGLYWQITPIILPELLSDPDKAKADRVMQAMMKMIKLDIGALKDASAAK